MLEIPGRGHDEVVRRIGGGVEALKCPTADGRDHLRPPDHGSPEGVGPEDGLGDDVVDEILRVVLDHGDLLEHDLALRVELGEDGLVDHPDHDVERRLQPIVRNARIEDGRLARRGGVELAAEAVEDLRDLLSGMLRGALEEQVLDEVGDPRAVIGLVAGACADPEAERDGANPGHLLTDHPLAGRKRRELVVLHGGDRTAALRCRRKRSARSATVPRPKGSGGRAAPLSDAACIVSPCSGIPCSRDRTYKEINDEVRNQTHVGVGSRPTCRQEVLSMTRTSLRIALFATLVAVLALVPSALAGKGRPGGGGGTTSGSGTIALTLLNSTDGLPHFGQKVTFAVSATTTTQPWVALECFQNGTVVYKQANGIFANSLNQVFTLGPTPAWTGGAADCKACCRTGAATRRARSRRSRR